MILLLIWIVGEDHFVVIADEDTFNELTNEKRKGYVICLILVCQI